MRGEAARDDDCDWAGTQTCGPRGAPGGAPLFVIYVDRRADSV